MKISFEATLPEVDSGRLMMDLPLNVCSKIEDKPMQKVNITINEAKYLCNLYKKDDGVFSLHIIQAIKREVGLGQPVFISLESVETSAPNVSDIHKTVIDWEITECKELMQSVGIKTGNQVIDFGCGYGHYSLACALALSNTGRVYAIDKDNKALKWINTKAEMFNVQNIETVKTNGALSIDLPDESTDIVLLYDIIHIKESDTKAPIRLPLYQEAYRVLKKGGILSILTFDSEIKKISIKNSVSSKTTYQDVIAEILEFGFKFSHSVEGGVHFDWYHSNHRMSKGISFSELERGIIYNFISI